MMTNKKLNFTSDAGDIIFRQLGGNKFIAMTGAKDFTAHEQALSFKIGRNKTSANYVGIRRNGLDTYDICFERVSMSRKTWDIKRKMIAQKIGVYCDMLQEVFTDVTGLHTKI